MRAVALLLLIGCGSAPAPVTPSSPDPEPTPTEAPVDAAIADAPTVVENPKPPLIAIANGPLLIEGDLDRTEVEARFDLLKEQAARCLGASGATTTELMLFVVGDRLELRSAWQNGAPLSPLPACLVSLWPPMPGHGADTKRADVYVAFSAGPVGAKAPDAPPPPDRKDSFQRMFCELDTLSGADKLPVEKRPAAMIAWARTNIRHPAPFWLAARVPTWAPQDRDYNLTKAIKAEGIKKCPMQRW